MQINFDLEDKFRRHAIALTSLWLGIIILVGSIVRNSISPMLPYTIVIIVLIALTLLLNRYLISRNINTTFCGILLITAVAALGINAGLSNGGVKAPVATALILTPIIGFFAAGNFGARIGLFYTFAGVFFLIFAEEMHWVAPVNEPSKFNYYKAAIQILAGLVTYAIGAAFESSRKITTNIIKTNEENLKNILTTVPACVKVISADGIILSMNQIGLRMMGANIEDEIIGQNIVDFIAPEWRTKYLDVHKKICTGSAHETLQFEVIGLDGARRWFESHASPLKNPDGSYDHLAITHDITDRKLQELYQSIHSQMMTSILEKKPLTSILEKIVHGIEEANPGLLGSILLLDDDQLFVGAAPSLPPFFNAGIDGVKIGPEVGSCGTAAYRKERVIVEDIESSPLWKNFHTLANKANLKSCWSLPIQDSNQILGTFAVYRRQSYSPSKMELGLIEEAAQLAAIAIQYRNAEEALAQHRAAISANSKMAALGEMASGIAHEINNPLAIIHGNINIIERQIEDNSIDKDKLSTYLAKIKTTTVRISNIIKALRSFSRNAEEDPMASASVNSIIDETMQFCSERIKNSNINLFITKSPNNRQLICRQTQIEQVLLNLINNSIDALEPMVEKWIKVTVEESDSKLRLIVTDSGSGIPDEIVEKMMQPFYTTKEVGKGTGLGLSISKGIIDNHKGRLYYDNSSPNTRFVIELPAS